MDREHQREALLNTLRLLCMALQSAEHIRPVPTFVLGHIHAGIKTTKDELTNIGCVVYYSLGLSQWMATMPLREEEQHDKSVS